MPRVWLAHGLTLSRVPLALALWWLWGDAAWSAALLALAAISDAADGMVARWAKRRGCPGPDIGGWLDPAVDKLFVVVVLAAIWTDTHLLALYLAFRRQRRELRADRLGKLATIAQFIALCVIALAPGRALPAAVVAAVLGLAAAGHYVVTAAMPRRGTPRA